MQQPLCLRRIATVEGNNAQERLPPALNQTQIESSYWCHHFKQDLPCLRQIALQHRQTPHIGDTIGNPIAISLRLEELETLPIHQRRLLKLPYLNQIHGIGLQVTRKVEDVVSHGAEFG